MTTENEQTPEQIAAESDAALSDGFYEARGQEPPKTEAEVKTPEPTTEGAAPASDPVKVEEVVVDPWAKVDPTIKAEFDSIREKLGGVEKIPERLRTIEGSLGGLSQLTKELKVAVATAATAAEAKGQATPTQAQVEYAAKSPERWKALKDDFPDFAELLAEEMGAVRAELAAKQAPQDVTALKTEIAGELRKRIEDAEQKAESARAHGYLDVKHFGWEAVIASQDFEAWYAKQPKETQALSASKSAKDAEKMLDLYAADQKKAAEKSQNKQRLERAIAPEGTVVTSVVEDPDEALAAGFNEVRGNRR